MVTIRIGEHSFPADLRATRLECGDVLEEAWMPREAEALAHRLGVEPAWRHSEGRRLSPIWWEKPVRNGAACGTGPMIATVMEVQ